MTDAPIDQLPVTSATDAPSPTPPTQGQEVVVQDDTDDLDLDFLDSGDDAGDGEVGEVELTDHGDGPGELAPWSPPDGQAVSEQAKPHLEKLDAYATERGWTTEDRDGLIDLYNGIVVAQANRHVALNKTAKAATVATLRAEHGNGLKSYLAEVDAAFASLPKEFRAQLKSAILPDGTRLINTVGAVNLFAQLAERKATTAQPKDRTSMLQRELRDIDALMSRDIDEYRRPWRGTGMSASARRAEILRELSPDAPVKPGRAQLANEEAELLALYESDPMVFEHPRGKRPGNLGRNVSTTSARGGARRWLTGEALRK
jgi:hypothetical protein